MNAGSMSPATKYSDFCDYIGGGHTHLAGKAYDWRSPDDWLLVISQLASEPDARCTRCKTSFTDMVKPNHALIFYHDLGVDAFIESVYLVCDSCWPKAESAASTTARVAETDVDLADATSRMLRELRDYRWDLGDVTPVLDQVVHVSGFGSGMEGSNLDIEQRFLRS